MGKYPLMGKSKVSSQKLKKPSVVSKSRLRRGRRLEKGQGDYDSQSANTGLSSV